MKIEELIENIGKIDNSVYTYTPKENDELITEIYVGDGDEPLAVIDEQQTSSIKFNTSGLPTELRPHMLELFGLIAQYGDTPLDERFGKKYRIRLIPSADSEHGGLYLNITNDQGNFDVVSEVHAEAYNEIELIKFAKIGNLDLSKNLVEVSETEVTLDDADSDGSDLNDTELSGFEQGDLVHSEQIGDDVLEALTPIDTQSEQDKAPVSDDYQDQSEPVVPFEETELVDRDGELNSDEPEYENINTDEHEEPRPLSQDDNDMEKPVKRIDPGQVATTVADKIAKRTGLTK